MFDRCRVVYSVFFSNTFGGAIRVIGFFVFKNEKKNKNNRINCVDVRMLQINDLIKYLFANIFVQQLYKRFYESIHQ